MPADATPSSGPADRRIAVAIPPEDAGARLDRALQRLLPELSRSRLKQLMLEGRIADAAGRVVRDPARRAVAGARLVVTLPAPVADAPAAEALALDIRFEDASLIVIDKPAGMVVHPAPGNPKGTLVNALLAHCGPSLAGIGGVRRPGIVHRLDKDTSGLLVAAKTEAAHHALSQDFAQRRIERAYLALVWGVPAPPAGEIAGNIGRSPANRKKMAVVAAGHGKPATTRYRVVRRFGRAGAEVAALVECRLLTGRTHQVRVHLAHIGHPLIGDPVYRGRARRLLARTDAVAGAIAAFPRQALHAARLGFTHPITAERLVFDSTPPGDMRALIANLELL
ncbi:MAG TPA: RluA family pseudouridine synthase [Stellaceae bacterium]|nr:RluA family pseudouridine synthase [Stellaceae bacterium]